MEPLRTTPLETPRTAMIRTTVLFLFLCIICVGVPTVTVVAAWKSGYFAKTIGNPLKSFINSLSESRDIEITPKAKPSPVPTDKLFSEFEKTTPTIVQQNKNTQTNTTQTRTCYRYTVTHLDGSTSNLCYTQSDYNQLVNLGYSYSSAKTFYQFQLDGAQRYQDEYDRTHSSIYLDAKASSLQQANREKEKMDAVVGQMQEIENRGY